MERGPVEKKSLFFSVYNNSTSFLMFSTILIVTSVAFSITGERELQFLTFNIEDILE